jgi:hypothetical protein
MSNTATAVFALKRFKATAKVAVVSILQDGKLAFHAFNFFSPEITNKPILVLTLRYVWLPSNLIQNVEDIFINQKDFHGRHFTIATNPWSHHVLGYIIPEDDGGTSVNKYKDYWGYEIDLLKAVQKVLNFDYTVVNPADGKWGHIKADGTWSGGLVAETAIGAVDFSICNIFIVFSRQQVFDGTITFDMDFMTLVSPMPHPLPKWIALSQPFHYFVWASLVASIIVIAVIFKIIARTEETIRDINLANWSTVFEAGWFCLGTILKESIANDKKTNNANAVRYCLHISMGRGTCKIYIFS